MTRESQNQIWLPLQPLSASFREQPVDPAAKSLTQMIVAWVAVSGSAVWKAKRQVLEPTHWHALGPVTAGHFVELAPHRPAAEILRTTAQPEISGIVVYW